MSQTYGKNIKRLRTSKGWTQKELARKLYKAESTIGMWEQGRREPDYESLKEISALFNVPVDIIIGNNFFSDLDSFLKQPLNQEPINELKEANLDELLTSFKIVYQGQTLDRYEIDEILDFARFKLSQRTEKN